LYGGLGNHAKANISKAFSKKVRFFAGIRNSVQARYSTTTSVKTYVH
jgi:hypothetical protein